MQADKKRFECSAGLCFQSILWRKKRMSATMIIWPYNRRDWFGRCALHWISGGLVRASTKQIQMPRIPHIWRFCCCFVSTVSVCAGERAPCALCIDPLIEVVHSNYEHDKHQMQWKKMKLDWIELKMRAHIHTDTSALTFTQIVHKMSFTKVQSYYIHCMQFHSEGLAMQ